MAQPQEPQTPHDAVFKKVFGKPVVAAEFFQAVLPPSLAQEIDWANLTLERESFVDEELLPSASDLLFSTRMGDESALLYCLFEHQSTPDARMPLRLLGYMNRIWDRLLANGQAQPDQLPPIIPVVLFQGPRSWQPSTRFIDSLNVPHNVLHEAQRYLVDFEYALVNLSDWDPAPFQGHVFLQGVLAILKAVRDGRVDEVAPVLFPVMGEVLSRSKATGILEWILYYVVKEGPEPLFKEMRRSLRATQGSNVEKRMMTKFAQQILERGEDRGEVKGLREAVIIFLQTRFGKIPADIREKIHAVDSRERLIQLNREACQSNSLDEFKEHL